MIDTAPKNWTVYSYRQDHFSGDWLVIGTRWTSAGPGDETLIATCADEDAARAKRLKSQQDYDRLRNILLTTAKEVNNE